MRFSLSVMVVLAALSVVSVAATAPKPRVLLRIVVRVYDSIGVATKVFDRAHQVSEEILTEAGVESAWRNCRMASGRASSSNDECSDPLDDRELIVRIVRAPEGIGGPDAAYGYSLVNTKSRSGSLATVFGDRVNVAADRVRVDGGTLLGRAMAHELGHLLLGSTEHSAEGLMRAVWSDRALLSRRAADWRFSAIDLSRLRVVSQELSSLSFFQPERALF